LSLGGGFYIISGIRSRGFRRHKFAHKILKKFSVRYIVPPLPKKQYCCLGTPLFSPVDYFYRGALMNVLAMLHIKTSEMIISP
ncbi:MAG: hypothetical protein ACI4HO_06825, partial [Ruminococcus sp.]